MNKENINSFYIIGVSEHISDPENAGEKIGALWQKIYDEDTLEKIPNVAENAVYAIYHSYAGDETQSYTITLGCKVSSLDDTPEDMDGLTLPTQDYSLFTAQGQIPDAIIETWESIWNSKINRAFTYDFERYDERSHNPEDAIIDIYIATK